MRRLVLHVFVYIICCKHTDEINQLLLLCYILCSKEQTSRYFDELDKLERYVTDDIYVSSNIPEEFKDENDNYLNGVIYREKVPFGRHFDLLYECSLVSLSEVDNISQSNSNSVSYTSQIIEFLLTQYLPVFPLWSGIILLYEI